MTESSSTDNAIHVAWDDFVRFFRQLSHDVRNHLNAAELQAAYLSEIAENPELKEEVKRLREMVAAVSKSLQQVGSRITPVNPTRIPYRCADLIEDVRQKLGSMGDGIEWDVRLEAETVEIDPQLLQDAIVELFQNAARYREGDATVSATARIHKDQFELIIRESKNHLDGDTKNWGRTPMHTVGRGHYGLGLNRVRMIVEAHGGRFTAEHDQQLSALISRIVLPLVQQSSG